MKKVEALIILLADTFNYKTSKTSYRRCVHALDALGFDSEEANVILEYMDYHGDYGPLPWTRGK